MRFVAFVFGVLIVSEIIVPYANPIASGAELWAIETINGSQHAVFQMTIKDPVHGVERYTEITKERLNEIRMENARIYKSRRADNIDANITVEDREKTLERALLPKKAQADEPLPIMISRAKCPQGLTYVGEYSGDKRPFLYDTNKKLVGYYDGENAEFVFARCMENAENGGCAKMGFYRADGLEDRLLFSYDFAIEDGGENAQDRPIEKFDRFISIDGKNFFILTHKIGDDWEKEVFAYTLDGYRKVYNGTFSMYANCYSFVSDDGEIYIPIKDGGLAFLNIDDGSVLHSGEAPHAPCDYFVGDPSIFTCGSGVESARAYKIKLGALQKLDNVRRWYLPHTVKSRFDYMNIPTVFNPYMNYNIKRGITTAPYKPIKVFTQGKILGVKEGYIVRGYQKDEDGNVINGGLYYTDNYRDYTFSGISANGDIIVTKEYVYAGNTVARIDGWAYEKPMKGELAQLYAKNGMLRSQDDGTIYIGGR